MKKTLRQSTTAASAPVGGLAAAFTAFATWGFLPLYFDLIGPRVSAWEILNHRVVWSAVLLGIMTLALGRAGRVRAALTNWRVLLPLILTAMLVSMNWGTFIWAVIHHQVIGASLGYYINPLLNVALGFVFLGERLRPLQWLAVAIAAAGVLFMVVAYGTVPWVGLILAGCFGSYGLIRKQLGVDSVTGLLMETLLLLPFSLIWLGWLYAHHDATFLLVGPRIDLLLVGAGVLTIVPFTLFAAGARRLRLGTIGLIQYLTPTLQFLSGVYILDEPFSQAEVVTFVCIWTGVVIYTVDLLRVTQRRRVAT